MTPPKATILIVEDEGPLRQALRVKLTSSDFNVLEAADGLEGWKVLTDKLPDLVLMDIRMPKMSGIEVIEKAQADPATKDIPIVLLSNSPDEYLVGDGMAAGAKGYLIKSNYSLEDIVQKIQSFLPVSNEYHE